MARWIRLASKLGVLNVNANDGSSDSNAQRFEECAGRAVISGAYGTRGIVSTHIYTKQRGGKWAVGVLRFGSPRTPHMGDEGGRGRFYEMTS